MTSRERILAVLRGEMPDRVPVTLLIQDQGHFLAQVYPDVDPWDYEQNQRNVIEIQKQLGLDVFVRMLFGLNDPLSIHMGGLNVSRSAENWEVTTEVRQRDNTRLERSTIRTPAGTAYSMSCGPALLHPVARTVRPRGTQSCSPTPTSS